MVDDRRKYIRFEVPLKAELVVRVDVDSVQQGTTKDFSREGLRLTVRNFDLIKGESIDMKIFIPDKKEPIPLRGQIVWSKPDHNWEVGIKISQIDKEAKSQILDYAYTAWRQKIKDSK